MHAAWCAGENKETEDQDIQDLLLPSAAGRLPANALIAKQWFFTHEVFPNRGGFDKRANSLGQRLAIRDLY